MKKTTLGLYALVCASLALTACGGGDSSQKPAATATAAAQPAGAAARPADKPAASPAKAGLQSIGDFFNAWNALYKQNEKVINAYEGMPIMELVTPGTTFIAQFPTAQGRPPLTWSFDAGNIDVMQVRLQA